MIEFVDDLPEARSGPERSARMAELADELRANPGRWAKWPFPLTKDATRARAQLIKNGKISAFPAGEFEAVTRSGQLYVRAVIT